MKFRHTLAGAVAALGSAVLLVLLAPSPSSANVANGKLQIIHLEAAQGDAAVLISPLGEVAMFDDGSNTTFCTNCPSCTRVKGQLDSLGVTHVKLHFTSHYHADHIGCITSLNNFPAITLDQGWDRAQSYSSGAYTTYTTYLGGRRHTLAPGMVFTLDSLSAHPVTITCIAVAGHSMNGASISTSDENSLSATFKISYGEFDEEVGGDLIGYAGGGTDFETAVGPQVGRVEVYKVHHHGSAYTSNDTWLNALSPKIGIITVGNGNSYGHPTSSNLTRLHNHGVRTYWTQLGAGVAPNPTWDKVANNSIRIVATWQPAGVDSIYAPGIADTFTNSGQFVDNVAPSVSILSPNGGEVLPMGQSTTIQWSASDNVGVTSVDVARSLDEGASWVSLATGIANSGSLSWTPPDSASTTALVRVTAHDAAANVGVGQSNADFTVADETAPSAVVTSPNGGESYVGGSTQNIAWNASDNVGVDSINADYSLNGVAGPWVAIQHGLANTGSYSWTLPSVASDSALVRVTAFDHALNQQGDLSDSLFQIQAPASVTPGSQAARFALYPAQPNPSRGLSNLRFSLAERGAARLEVMDVAGRRVWQTPAQEMSAGDHLAVWDGRDSQGGQAHSGIYFARLSAGARHQTVKFVLLR